MVRGPSGSHSRRLGGNNNLLTITPKKVLGHDRFVPTAPDDTTPLAHSHRAMQ